MQQIKQPRKQQPVNSGYRVLGRGGVKLGSVDQPINADETGELTAFTMRCGLLRRSVKLIPAEFIKDISATTETVVVRLTKKSLRDMLNASPADSGPHPIEVSLPQPAKSKVFENGAWRVTDE